MKKLVYIISDINHSVVFERTIIELSHRFDISLILINSANSGLEENLKKCGIRVERVPHKSKLDLLNTFWRLVKLLREIKPDIVHCHLITATLLGLAACKFLCIKNRIYTRHHSTFHHNYAPHAIKYDFWANRNASKIIAVSNTLKDILVQVEHVEPSKVMVVEHGVDIDSFHSVAETRIESVRLKYGISKDSFIVGSVSRYDEWKGVEFTIDAFKGMLSQIPNAFLILANAQKGDYVFEITKKLSELPVGCYLEIPFETDVQALYKCFDVLVHVPIDSNSEAFGQVYVEAMASGIALVATKSGVGNDLLKHLETGYIVSYKNSREIQEGLKYLRGNPGLKNMMLQKAYDQVKNNYSFESKLNDLMKVYQNL